MKRKLAEAAVRTGLVTIVTTAVFMLAGCGDAGGIDEAERAVDGRQAAESGLCVAAQEFMAVNIDFWGDDLALDAPADEVREPAALAEDALDALEELRVHVDEDRFVPLFEAWRDSFETVGEAYREIDYDLSRLDDPDDTEAWNAFDDAWASASKLAREDLAELADAFGAEMADRCGLSPYLDPAGPPAHPGPTDEPDASALDAPLTLRDAMATVVREHIELARDGELGDRRCPVWEEETLSQQLGVHVDDLEVVPSLGMGWSVAGDAAAFTCSMELMDPGRSTHVSRLVLLTVAIPADGYDPGVEFVDVGDHGQAGYHVEESDTSSIHALTVVDPDHDIQITIESSDAHGGRDVAWDTLEAILDHHP